MMKTRVLLLLSFLSSLYPVAWSQTYYWPGYRAKYVHLADAGGSTSHTLNMTYIGTVCTDDAAETIAADWTFSNQPDMNAGIGFASGAQTITWNAGNTTFDFSETIAPTSINTGIGDTEVYLMDQNVRTSDSPRFAVVYTDQYLAHYGDADTSISMTTDAMSLYAGGFQIIELVESNTATSSGTLTFNQDARNLDVAFESDSTTDTLFIDGDNSRIGFLTHTPSDTVHIQDATPYLIIEDTGSNQGYVVFLNTTTGNTHTSDGFYVGINGNEDGFLWHRENEVLYIGTNNAERINIAGDGTITFNDTGIDFDVIFETDTTTDTLYIDAGADNIGIKDHTPSYELDINGDAATQRVYGYGDADTHIDLDNGDQIVITAGNSAMITITEDANYDIVDMEKAVAFSEETWSITGSSETFDPHEASTCKLNPTTTYDLDGVPTIADGDVPGQRLLLYNSTGFTLKFQDETDLSGSNLRLDGATTQTLGQRDNFSIMWDGTDWIQISKTVDN